MEGQSCMSVPRRWFPEMSVQSDPTDLRDSIRQVGDRSGEPAQHTVAEILGGAAGYEDDVVPAHHDVLRLAGENIFDVERKLFAVPGRVVSDQRPFTELR